MSINPMNGVLHEAQAYLIVVTTEDGDHMLTTVEAGSPSEADRRFQSRLDTDDVARIATVRIHKVADLARS